MNSNANVRISCETKCGFRLENEKKNRFLKAIQVGVLFLF